MKEAPELEGISFTTCTISIMGGRMKFISNMDVFIGFS
jgi:hypothetical protein